MSDAGLHVLDGAQLTSTTIDFSSPDLSAGPITGDRVLEVAEARASECLYGVTLPGSLTSAARQLIKFDVTRHQEVLGKEQADGLARDYIAAIADALRDDPLVVSVLDGNTIRLFLEDEDDFAMLAENLFTGMDVEDEGKLSKSELQSALFHMGIEMGVPPLSDFPMINDILKKHGAEGEEKLGQAQFAQLLQPILQDLADALAVKHVTVIQNVKIVNGSELRKLLADKDQLDDLIEKIYQQKHDDQKEQTSTECIRSFLVNHGKELGLPTLEGSDAVSLLYDAVFSDVGEEKRAMELEKSEFGDLVKQILQKFVVQLQANPVFHETDD